MAVWRKSSFSGGNTDCVEVASTPDLVGVRDSKAVSGEGRSYTLTHARHLAFPATTWRDFIDSLD